MWIIQFKNKSLLIFKHLFTINLNIYIYILQDWIYTNIHFVSKILLKYLKKNVTIYTFTLKWHGFMNYFVKWEYYVYNFIFLCILIIFIQNTQSLSTNQIVKTFIFRINSQFKLFIFSINDYAFFLFSYSIILTHKICQSSLPWTTWAWS